MGGEIYYNIGQCLESLCILFLVVLVMAVSWKVNEVAGLQ